MDKTVKITFGTSGWRAVIADGFTFDNVGLVTQAIADYVKIESKTPEIIIGYDTRFLSKEFAESSAWVLSANKIKVLLCNRDTPTPVLAYQVINRKLSGAINFTASHNPPEYNGIKFSPAYGGPASKQVTSAIEKQIEFLRGTGRRLEINNFKNVESAIIKKFDPQKSYLKRIKEFIDLEKIKKAKLNIAVDCLYGTGRGYLDFILTDNCFNLKVLHNYLDPYFGGYAPEPNKMCLRELIKLVKKEKFNLGLALDGDADRFGIIDKGGIFFNANQIITLLFHYLLKTRPKAKTVARTISTTHMIDAIALKHGIEVIETPVGFKYIGYEISKGECIIGGEESGGLSVQGHIPEKDGILACLLVAEMVAVEKKSLREILKSLYKQYGCFYSDRINSSFKEKEKKKIFLRLQKISTQHNFLGLKIKTKNFIDGYKFIFTDNSWVMFRLSGTEPVIRCYFEAQSTKQLNYLKEASAKILQIK
ncbi:MAG: phosphoglucomutase/phosphomannomutase family protein [Candidatus Omnitrophota bacterium]|nr:MAG: phosphoglucomutase/phosphomannomutase family protein [Candidatus Omnitrophota bacterium]